MWGFFSDSKLKGGAPYFESVEDMRIFLNGEDIDLEVFHLCVQPGAHIHVCNKRDAFPDGTFPSPQSFKILTARY